MYALKNKKLQAGKSAGGWEVAFQSELLGSCGRGGPGAYVAGGWEVAFHCELLGSHGRGGGKRDDALPGSARVRVRGVVVRRERDERAEERDGAEDERQRATDGGGVLMRARRRGDR